MQLLDMVAETLEELQLLDTILRTATTSTLSILKLWWFYDEIHIL